MGFFDKNGNKSSKSKTTKKIEAPDKPLKTSIKSELVEKPVKTMKMLLSEENEALTKLNLNEIIQVNFPENQYYKEQTDKKQVVLHHTVSGQGTEGDISCWLSTADRIATQIVIGWDGKIYQCFSSMYWGHHLGVTKTFLQAKGFADYETRNVILNKAAIGVEIDSWGALVYRKGHWYPARWDNVLKTYLPDTRVLPIKNVQTYPNGFKGFYGYEKYTDAQIDAVRKLLVYWNERYEIPLTYNTDMWDISMKALSGNTGVWTHVSYREDKSDCHPQPELIQMLQSL